MATPWLARFMLALAVAATLAANVGYGLPFGVTGALISGWPAIAFVGSVEMVIGLVRRSRQDASESGPGAHRQAAPESDRVLYGSAHPERSPGAPRVRIPDSARNRARSVPVTVADAEREFMADLASGTIPSLRQIRARMHVGQERARALREHLEPVAVGAGPPEGRRPDLNCV